jgi:hypothetical protein
MPKRSPSPRPTDFLRTSIESSSLLAIAYSKEQRIMEAEFRSGDTYRFYLVPLSAYEALIRSDSVGAHFNRSVKDKYPFTKRAGKTKKDAGVTLIAQRAL